MPTNAISTALKNGSRLAGLDIHSPLCLKSKESPNKIGDIGSLYSLIDKVSQSGFSLIQFTPIHDTGLNNNPYVPLSFFSLNPIYLDISDTPFPSKTALDEYQGQYKPQYCTNETINYQPAYQFKINFLKQSYIYFSRHSNSEFIKYKKDLSVQTKHYVVYKVLSLKFKTAWYFWPEEFKTANIEHIISKHPELSKDIDFYLFTQWLLHYQWQKVISYANSKNISFVIDKPFLPFPDSADVWANQHLFYLNSDGSPRYISGANNPGDPYGQQEWGHAVLQFAEQPQQTSQFLIEHIKFISQFSSVIRLDHTLGLAWKYYLIDSQTRQGLHREALKDQLFSALSSQLSDLFLIAEDIGYSNEEIDNILNKYNIPTMRCPQWVRDSRQLNISDYPKRSLVFTSNHDINSLTSWWQQLSGEEKNIFVGKIFPDKKLSEITLFDIIEKIFSAKSQIAMISLRDLENDPRRYNIPGEESDQNWSLRMKNYIEDLDLNLLKTIIKQTNRFLSLSS